MGSLATVEHYNSEHQYEHTRHQSRSTQEGGGPPGTSPGARMVGDPAYPSSAAGPGADPRRGLRTRTRGELRQRRGGGRRSRRRVERVATPEGGGGRSDTARDDGCRRSGTPEEPLGGGLSGHRGHSEAVPRPGAVGRGAAAVDGGGGEMADAAAVGPRGGGGAMAGGGGRGATAVGGTGGGLVGSAAHPQICGRGAQSEERGWGRAMRAIPSAVVARGTTHSPLRRGVAHRRRSRRRRRSAVGHAALEAGPSTHAAIHRAAATGGAKAKRRVDRAADATTAEGGSSPGTGGRRCRPRT